ncbi:MAG TPA: UDP-N-acetylmuramoyl-L-alanine--D-glutamate ligase [Steroidobacteraceae bacterium]|nr:UDP-N-acetylmuramoyl-L-alanine--D-glutamate ligase [Steroidobacteraceae bacterium]
MNRPSHPDSLARALAGGPARAVIVGAGLTGLSVARLLLARGIAVAVTDTRGAPPELAALRTLAAQSGRVVTVRTGGFDATLLADADLVVVSPGVATSGPFFETARARRLPIVGDIELFARLAMAPVAGITGTNGKSTVTTLLAGIAARAGVAVRAGGNLGPPALELLAADAALYVLEISSFQLETTDSLRLKAAAVLNVTPDHLDRYADLASYAAAKARIYTHCEVAVVNLDDPLVPGMLRQAQPSLSFSLRAGARADYTLQALGGGAWLVRRGEPLLPLAQLRIAGAHNAANALAALALAEALALPTGAALEELRSFPGLAHRTQWIAEVRGVRFINDSKGTNVGATVAAVSGLPGPLLLILGGEGKGQDFRPLRAAFDGKVRYAALIGRDADALAHALAGICECEYAGSLEEAVQRAAQRARPGETVLLSPACASLDMFRNYAHRGSVFAEAVQRLVA